MVSRTQNLFQAVHLGDIQQVAAWLDSGTDLNLANEDECGCEDEPKTALHIAAKEGHLEVVRLLLDRGASVDHVTRFLGSTALHIAALKGRVGVVRLLLDRGAAVDYVDKMCRTPLYIAAARGHVVVVRLLLERGAVADHAVEQDWTARHEVASLGNLELFSLLFPHYNPIDGDSRYPLLDYLFKHPKGLKSKLRASSFFIERLATSFPEHHEQLLNWLFAHAEILKQALRKSFPDLFNLIDSFPKHREQLCIWLSENPEVLMRMSSNMLGLSEVAYCFAEHHDLLLNCLFGRPEALARILRDSSDLRDLAGRFPDYAHIFAKPSVAEALQAIAHCQARWEMKQTARVLVQASRTAPESFPSKLAKLDLYPKVLSFLGPSNLSPVHAEKVAASVYNGLYSRSAKRLTDVPQTLQASSSTKRPRLS